MGGWDERVRIWEDWDLLLRLHADGARFVTLDETTFEYRVRTGSVLGGWQEAMCAGPVLGAFVARHPLLADFHRAHPRVYAELFAGTAVDLTGLVPHRPRYRRILDPVLLGGPRRRRWVARVGRRADRA